LGYRFWIETIRQLWNTPGSGSAMSTMSGISILISGRKIRSVAYPIPPSSCGGLLVTIEWYTGSRWDDIEVTCSTGNGSTGV
jgi:hypothetical protein